MKFTEGYWLKSERANPVYASDAHYVKEIENGMRILCPTKKILGRGDVLNLPTITLKCADYDVYHDMEEYLLEEQKIFNYLENTSVNFVTVEEQREIIFYL